MARSFQQRVEADIQGWYRINGTADPVRVRLSMAGHLLMLHTLAGRLIASWSLNRLENREIPLLGERWLSAIARCPKQVSSLRTTKTT